MTREEFVSAVKRKACDAAVHATMQMLAQPPGRRPDQNALELASWYNALNPQHKSNVQSVVQRAAASAIFGLLAILDGERTVEGIGEKGDFELFYRKGSDRVFLNDPTQEMLHDTFCQL